MIMKTATNTSYSALLLIHIHTPHHLHPSCTARIAIEAGVTPFWYKYVGLNGKVIGMELHSIFIYYVSL